MLCVLQHQALFAVIHILVETCVSAATQRGKCSSPLGMEDGRIKNSQISAKSWLYFDRRDNRYYRPQYARLNYDQLSGGWCSADFARHPGQYLEIDLMQNTLVTAIATQGRHNGQEWVEQFQVEYLRTNDTKFRKFEENRSWRVFRANSDTNNTVKHVFSRPLVLQKMRIVPLGNQFTIYCMRTELYGCRWKPSEDGLVSYSAPLGGLHKRTALQDMAYDGFIPEYPSEFVFGGLGKFTDGEIGSKWFMDYSKDTGSTPWVAYTRDPVIIFVFNNNRRFNSITLHVFHRNKRIKLFSLLEIEASQDGVTYEKIANYVPLEGAEGQSGPFTVKVGLNSRQGKYLRCSFQLKGILLLISEVEFDTVPALTQTTTENFTQPPQRKFVKTHAVTKQRIGERNSVLDIDRSEGASSDGLSFPIILTIVLVATVSVAALLAVFVRCLRSSRKLKVKSRREQYESKQKHSEACEDEKLSFTATVAT